MSCCLLNSRKNRRLFPHLRFPLQILSEINLKKKIKFQIKLTHCHSSWRNKSYSLRKKPTSTQWINLWKKKSPFLRKIWFKIQKSWCLPARKNMCMDEIDHGLRTPNEGINQWYLKNWADMADTIRFGCT